MDVERDHGVVAWVFDVCWGWFFPSGFCMVVSLVRGSCPMALLTLTSEGRPCWVADFGFVMVERAAVVVARVPGYV